MDDHRMISSYLDAQSAEMDAADNTQSAYGRDLLDFSAWLGNQGRNLSEAQRVDIENYLIH